jgi:hypothetical protein
MEQLDDPRVALTELEPKPSPVAAQHLRTSPCKRPAHFRPGTNVGPTGSPAPRHFRAGGPMHMAPEAVRIAKLAPAAPTPRPSAGMVANAAFVRRLHTARPVHVWPDDIAERVTSSSVWPETLRSITGGDVETCMTQLLFSSASDDFLARRRATIGPVYPTLPFWESRWTVYRQNLGKPVPLGIAAGMSAVLALAQTSESTAAPNLAAAAERTVEETASRGMRGAFVATPAMAPIAVTTTTAPPTTLPPAPTTAKPAPTTAKPKPKSPATVPAQTSQCSTSKAAAHACWDGLIGQYNWNTTTAFNIMWCESRGNPNAKNPRSTATGLFQILNGPYDPAANVKLAYEMYSKRGWQPWVCKG